MAGEWWLYLSDMTRDDKRCGDHIHGGVGSLLAHRASSTRVHCPGSTSAT